MYSLHMKFRRVFKKAFEKRLKCNVHLPAGAAIPLFTFSKNKEITSKSWFTADSIVLSNLLGSDGLNIDTAKFNASNWKVL